MNKKAWSVILLCLTAISFLLTVVIFVNTGISIFELENTRVDSSNDMLPGASIVGAAFAIIGIWGGFVLLGGFVASIGFLSSLINTKIASNPIIKRISVVTLYAYSVILILLIGILIYCIASVF